MWGRYEKLLPSVLSEGPMHHCVVCDVCRFSFASF